MTMVPAQSLSKVKNQQQQQQRRRRRRGEERHGGSYGGCAESFGLMINRLEGYDHCYNNCFSTESNSPEYSDLVHVANCDPMAEDESRTNSLNNEDGSSSKDVQDEKDEGWLQLSIGGALTTNSHEFMSPGARKNDHDDRLEEAPTSTARRGGLIELDLLPGSSSSNNQASRPSSSSPFFHIPHEFRAHPRPTFGTSLFFQHHPGLGSSSAYPSPPLPPHHHLHQEFSWAFRPTNIAMPPPYNIATALSSSSSSLSLSSSSALMPLRSYFSRPLHQVHSGIDAPGPSSDFRVIDSPSRPYTGIWFMLQASQNQSKEPFLPQVSKSYLRIKDGRMTVRLIMKYLVNKLKLDSESEVEITCRGQQLPPFLTLQHVRDNIWSPSDAVTLLPDSSTTDHVMVLHYARSA